MRSRFVLAIAVGVFVMSGSPAHAAGDLAAKCKDAKAKATGKKAFDLMKAFGKNGKKPHAAKLGSDISKAQAKFTKAFTKAESTGACLTSGDSGTIEAKVDAFVADMVFTQQGVGYGFCGASAEVVDPRIDELLPQMTIEEKVEQMTGWESRGSG
jgi:hypothetical protein